jgi:pyruvate/2-oxoglutarate dehydrogenase complex dihydrolipoamide dehydrogenase (E3) component
VLPQEARLTGPHRVETADGTVWKADRVVLTTGSEASVPPVPGLDEGGFWTNREAIWHGEGVPASLAILGAGAIGVEFAQIYARFGARVTVVEAMDRVLPQEDRDSSAAITSALGEEGIRFLTGTRCESAERTEGGGWRLAVTGAPAVGAERLLVATGRHPVLEGHDLAAAGVELDDAGRPRLTETLRTTAPHIWAGGDATGELLFTHVGEYEATVIVADILGRPFPVDYRVIPRVTYCEPEVASVGLTEEQALDAGRAIRVGRVPFADRARSFLEGESAWHVKIVADAGNGEVLGGHIVGEAAGELLGEIVLAMAGRVPAAVAGRAVHPYPTRSETVQAAMRAAGGED